jgi:recombination protein RecR
MPNYPKSLEELINCLIKLPGIGRRSAERICHYLISASDLEINRLSSAILKVKEKIRLCKICNNLCEDEICKICEDETRERDIICVVEELEGLLAIERAGNFKGLYHVLLGSVSPLEGKGLKDLKVNVLINRIKRDNIKEVIIATDTDTEGEATALYLTDSIKPLGVRLTRIGMGIPAGSNLEYLDAVTLSKALESRKEI